MSAAHLPIRRASRGSCRYEAHTLCRRTTNLPPLVCGLLVHPLARKPSDRPCDALGSSPRIRNVLSRIKILYSLQTAYSLTTIDASRDHRRRREGADAGVPAMKECPGPLGQGLRWAVSRRERRFGPLGQRRVG